MAGEPSSKQVKTNAGKKQQVKPKSRALVISGGTGGASSSNANSEPSFAKMVVANPRFYEPLTQYNDFFFTSKKSFKLFNDHYREGIVTAPTFNYMDNLLGKKIDVDLAMMSQILGAPNAGHCCYSDHAPVIEGGALHSDMQWEIVGGPDAPKKKPIQLKYLDPLRFVLWHMVMNTILSRVENLSEVKCVEVWVIGNLIKKRKLDLGYLVLSLMSRSKIPMGELKPYLPYAHFIMDILEDQGIVVPPSSEFTSTSHCFNKLHIICNLNVDYDRDKVVTYQGGQIIKKVYYWVRPSDDEDEYMDEESEEEDDGDYGDEDDDIDIDMLGLKMKDLMFMSKAFALGLMKSTFG